MSDLQNKKVIFAALAGNTLIAIMKFIAAYTTKSSALFSEGIHSLVDTGNQILLLYGLHRAKRPPDQEYPFGYGKEIYFWSFVVAVMIFAVGASISISQGIEHIKQPAQIQNIHVSYIVLGLSFLFEGAAWLYAFTEFRKVKGSLGYIKAVQRGKDPSMFMVLFEDSAAMLGIMIAAGGIFLTHYTGNGIYDGIASVLIGCLLGFIALWLAYETKGLLIGESASKSVIAGIRKIAEQHECSEFINEVLTMHMGPDYVLVNLSVEFDDNISAQEVEDTIAAMDKQIKLTFPEVKRVFIEAEARKHNQGPAFEDVHDTQR